MDLAGYFANTSGRGVLATASSEGMVDAAVYSRPHVIDGNTVAFIMRDRLSHANVTSNPHATYLFMEDGGGGYLGVRLFLTKTGEEEDSERLHALRIRSHRDLKETPEERGRLFLTFFRVERVLPLVASRGLPAALAEAV